MGKGGGGGGQQAPTQTESTVTQTNLPEYVRPFFENVLERTEAESLRPYEPFPDQRLAEFSPEQLESFGVAGDIARAGVPDQLGIASQRLEDVAAFRPGYTAGTFAPGDFTAPGVAERYQNPFVENVIDVQQARARRQFEEDVAPQLAARATQAGAFGGSREGIASGLARSRLEDRLGDLEATQRAQAFREAGTLFERDRTAALRAQALQEQAAQQEARLGLAGEQLGMRAAPQLAALGAQEQALGLRGADVLRQIGEQQRAFDQQQLDIGLADFLSQRDFPRQQLAYYGGILHGVPVSPISEVSQYQAQPSMGQQMLGFGLGGLGLARSVMGT
tara:strand:- start:20 stop:1021 length:1002 start_codon:yes stop_codon:yes gene_type:complete